MPGTYISPADSGLYYLQSRYYDPVTGRFINTDGLVSTGTGIIGHNMLAYCNNNPVVMVDPLGNTVYRADFIGPLQPGDIRMPRPNQKIRSVKDNIVLSKKATNRRDTGLQGYSDDEIKKKARDKSLPGKERKRYQEEEKTRGLRNKQKRQSNISVYDDNESEITVFPSDTKIVVSVLCFLTIFTVFAQPINSTTFNSFTGIQVWDENERLIRDDFVIE